MMKKFVTLLVVMLLVACFPQQVFCSDTSDAISNITVEITGDEIKGATLVSDYNYSDNGTDIIVKEYNLDDGTTISDITEVQKKALTSKRGSISTTRVRTISGWGTITISANFMWYTSGNFSYVKCSSMSARRSLSNSNITVSTWEKSYTSDFVAIGKAKASVKYFMYNSKVPTQYKSGTFTVTCTDSGTVSDNGD